MTDYIRAVTQDEVTFYQANGWVHLPALVASELITRLAAKATELHRPDGTVFVSAVAEAFGQNRGLAEIDEDFATPVFSSVMADSASRLLPGRPRVRLQINNLLVKEPVGRSHGATVFHQDFPAMPMDRSLMLTVWLALVDIPADMGSLRFYSGSHQFGVLGRSFVKEGDDALSQHPWLKNLEVSPPLNLAAGDATVHSALTIHGAAPNVHDRPRLSFAWTYFDADTLYTGAPFGQTDNLGLTKNEPFDHPAFPVVPSS